MTKSPAQKDNNTPTATRKNLDGNEIITIENPPKWLRDWIKKAQVQKAKKIDELSKKDLRNEHYA